MWFNWILAAAFLLLGAYQFWILPAWLLPMDRLWGYTLIPIAMLSNTYWALLHDTFHGSFHHSTRANVVAGRTLAIFFGAPFYLLRIGHLLHHGYNRTEQERIEVYDDARVGRLRAALAYYWQLLGGLYALEFASVLVFLLPRRMILSLVRTLADNKSLLPLIAANLTKPHILGGLRMDSALILLVLGTSLWTYGEHLWMLLLALGLRGFLISFADYVYHYGTPLDDSSSGRNLWLPKPLSVLLLHFNLHGVHHGQPQVGWQGLPGTFPQSGQPYSGAMLPALLRQLCGPIPLSRLAPAAIAAQLQPHSKDA